MANKSGEDTQFWNLHIFAAQVETMSHPAFTAHNILLPDGSKTRDNAAPLLAETQAWKSIEKTIHLFFPIQKEERQKLKVVDLGCLEGGYTVEFARLGFTALGIEAREANVEKCNYVKEQLHLSNLSFVTDNVRNLDKYGKFDIVLNYGLLYHLDDPFRFIKAMHGSMSENSLLLLNTHFAPENDPRYDHPMLNKYIIGPIQKRIKSFKSTYNHRLSPLTENEGYRGRWYKEWSPQLDKKKIEKLLWASYDNERSFWMCKKDLATALQDAGFDHVFERFDFTGDIFQHNDTHYYNRTMFVALKGFHAQ